MPRRKAPPGRPDSVRARNFMISANIRSTGGSPLASDAGDVSFLASSLSRLGISIGTVQQGVKGDSHAPDREGSDLYWHLAMLPSARPFHTPRRIVSVPRACAKAMPQPANAVA